MQSAPVQIIGGEPNSFLGLQTVMAPTAIGTCALLFCIFSSIHIYLFGYHSF